MSAIPKWMGARPEPLRTAIVGDIKPWRWPTDWFSRLIGEPVKRPPHKLATVLYPRKEPTRK